MEWKKIHIFQNTLIRLKNREKQKEELEVSQNRM